MLASFFVSTDPLVFTCVIAVLLPSFFFYLYNSSTPKPTTIVKTQHPFKFTESTDRGIHFKSQYIPTPLGRTYTEQWTTNKSNGRHMLLVHGFSMSDTMTTAFAPFIVDKLKNSNQITVPIRSITAIHLYGRGLSDCPLVPHSVSLFLSQITSIMTSLNLNGRIILCGMSMGGAIVAKFANLYPNRIHKLVMLSPAGCTPTTLPLAVRLLKTPLIGDLLINIFASKIVNVMEQSVGKEMNLEKYGDRAQRALRKHIEKVKMMYGHKGFVPALLSTLRHFEWDMKDVFDELYETDAFDNERWIFIWGTKDTTCPMKRDDLYPGVKVIKLEGDGHCDVIEDYCIEQYADEFIDWLNGTVVQSLEFV